MPTPAPPPVLATLDTLIDTISTTHATRRRQLRMVRAEFAAALDRDALPVAARRDVRRLLADRTLAVYLRLAESGQLRSRLLHGKRPPTSAATNTARHDCLQLLRVAASLPPWRPAQEPVPPRPTPGDWELAMLRRRLGELLGGFLTPGQTRFTAMIAMVLDTEARAGELVAQRLTDLAPDTSRVRIVRRPQHGVSYEPEPEDLTLSPLGRIAVERWLPVREELVARAHGTSRLWVSVWLNHSGTPDADGNTVQRPPGMPLEQSGLLRAYRTGRHGLGLDTVLPPKLEQLRRAVAGQRVD
ncbi:hypothetical protein SRB5_26610 [Streptomyces sp. RB5]|uniref:Uncharacterized protein n=1 Tax=Streptomyces smaragdinus TaxID=2585196 RepID=A0A7K0CGK4_9ACTN|nr:hypothetical protein [Streptomyces smaragdinus]MQY12526.1 hypothetical protein [Streptomyces smaragdinus]